MIIVFYGLSGCDAVIINEAQVDQFIFSKQTLAPNMATAQHFINCISLSRDFNIPVTDLDTIGNPQGVCTDGKYIYVSYRQYLYKYDMNGNLLLSHNTTSEGTYGDDKGDLCVKSGILYITSSDYRYGGTNGAIMKYNASSLSYIGEILLLTPSSVPSTITCHDDKFWIHFYSSPGQIHQYSADLLINEAQYILNDTYDGITWINNILVCNIHEDETLLTKSSDMDLYYFDGFSFRLIACVAKPDLWGQGIDFYNGTIYIVERGYTVSANKIIIGHFGMPYYLLH